MPAYVLDTSALLALLYEEPGGKRIEMLLTDQQCLIGAVNLAEFATKCADAGMQRAQIESIAQSFDVQIVPLDENIAYRAGLLRPITRAIGLSLGDRCCLALAQSLGAVAVTADRPWLDLIDLVGVEIECIRPNRH
ncbi:MAG TPA: type II toxin-antitoxin system VapC family toxin [Rhodocyclaceae bacterium]|nr:type II toxin-antitoxin system VapC family toxin [Rhodocyclaceae bacterium]